jgi:hypothetical protein
LNIFTRIIVCALLAVLPIAGCGDSGGSDSDGVSGLTVYVAGNILNSKMDYTGGYWKNGTWNEFINTYSTSGTGLTWATCIAVSGSDVYVGGESTDKNDSWGIAGYWKNGTWVELANPYSTSSVVYAGCVTSIAVADGKVYAAGFCYNSTYDQIAGYWMPDGSNVTWVELANPYNTSTRSYLGNANSIIVAADCKVYIGGVCYSSSVDIAGYWESDGIKTTWVKLSNVYGSDGWVGSITIADGKVYAGGASYNSSDIRIAGYWMSDGSADPVWVELANTYNTGITAYDGSVYSITVADGKVYAGGTIYNSSSVCIAGYWVSDGTTKTWTGYVNPYDPSMQNDVSSIAISGSDVYLAAKPSVGKSNQYGGYYKNGIWIELKTSHSLADYPYIETSQIIVQ